MSKISKRVEPMFEEIGRLFSLENVVDQGMVL